MSKVLARYRNVPLVEELFNIEQAAADLSQRQKAIKQALAQQGVHHVEFTANRLVGRDDQGRFLSGEDMTSAFFSADSILNTLTPLKDKESATDDEAKKIRKARKAEEEAVAGATDTETEEEDIGVSADLALPPDANADADKDKKKKPAELPELPTAYQGFLQQMVKFGAQSIESVHQMLGDDFISRLKNDGRGIEFDGEKMKIHYKGGGHIEVEPVHGRLFITLHGKKMDDQSAEDIVRLQKARGASVIDVNGPKAAKQLLWRAAQEQGLNVSSSSYKPTAEDLKWLEKRAAEKEQERTARAEAQQKQENNLRQLGLYDVAQNLDDIAQTYLSKLNDQPNKQRFAQDLYGKLLTAIGYEAGAQGLEISSTGLSAGQIQALEDNFQDNDGMEALKGALAIVNPEGRTLTSVFQARPAPAEAAPAPEAPQQDPQAHMRDLARVVEDTRAPKEELLLDSRYEEKPDAPKSRFGALIGNAAQNAKNDVRNASKFLGGLTRKIGLGAKPDDTPALDTPAQQASKPSAPALKPPGR